ncbi:hypothetical protein PL11201_470092 [Planktothrix sp. PCC 11201]|nr:hypothetical protein PL11201_470092 [Planktothrix sp. PCC 11201]
MRKFNQLFYGAKGFSPCQKTGRQTCPALKFNFILINENQTKKVVW